MINLNTPELQKEVFRDKANKFEQELRKTEEYIKMYSALEKKLSIEFKFYRSLSEPDVKVTIEKTNNPEKSLLKGFCHIKKLNGELVKINVHIGKVSDFKEGKQDKRALHIAKMKVDDFIYSNLSRFFSED
jgi:hypothetical protein